MQEPCLLLDGSLYGSHSGAVFCKRYFSELEEQGLGDKARAIIAGDRATSVFSAEEYSGEEQADLTERATWAWEDILIEYRPEPGYCMDYLPNSEALYAIPIGFDWDKWDAVKWRPIEEESE